MPNVFVKLPVGQGIEILGLLKCGSSYGYDLTKKLGAKASSVYTTLSRLEESGFIRGEMEEDPHEGSPFPRKVYKITQLGKDALEQAKAKKK